MDSGKYRQYTNGLVIGAVGVSMVVGEQHPHIHQHGPVWPESALYTPVVAGTTSSSWSTYSA
jgi:hypothetical protein